MALNNSCPEGYLKKGGKCKKCENGSKFNPHKALFTPSIYFKNGGIAKMFFGNILGAVSKVKDGEELSFADYKNSLKNRKATTVKSIYKQNPGFEKETTWISGIPGSQFFIRDIDITPVRNDTIYRITGNKDKSVLSKEEFDRAYNSIPRKNREVKTGNIISIPFSRH